MMGHSISDCIICVRCYNFLPSFFFDRTGPILLYDLRAHAWRELDGAPRDRAAVHGGRSKGHGQPVGRRVHRTTHLPV